MIESKSKSLNKPAEQGMSSTAKIRNMVLDFFKQNRNTILTHEIENTVDLIRNTCGISRKGKVPPILYFSCREVLSSLYYFRSCVGQYNARFCYSFTLLMRTLSSISPGNLPSFNLENICITSTRSYHLLRLILTYLEIILKH